MKSRKSMSQKFSRVPEWNMNKIKNSRLKQVFLPQLLRSTKLRLWPREKPKKKLKKQLKKQTVTHSLRELKQLLGIRRSKQLRKLMMSLLLTNHSKKQRKMLPKKLKLLNQKLLKHLKKKRLNKLRRNYKSKHPMQKKLKMLLLKRPQPI